MFDFNEFARRAKTFIVLAIGASVLFTFGVYGLTGSYALVLKWLVPFALTCAIVGAAWAVWGSIK